MGTTHVIRHDLQLGLGVDPGPIREQQAAAELGRISALGGARHPHSAVEHAAAPAIGHGLMELVELPFRTFKSHVAVGVGDLLTRHQLQTAQGGGGAAIHLDNPRL